MALLRATWITLSLGAALVYALLTFSLSLTRNVDGRRPLLSKECVVPALPEAAAMSAEASEFLRATGGVCRSFDGWEPLVKRAFYHYKPRSVAEQDVNATFAEQRVGHWITVKDGRLWLRRHPEGFTYSYRGPSILAQLDRMLQRGWAVPDFHLLFEVGDAPRFIHSNAHLVRAPVGAMAAMSGYMDVPIWDATGYWWDDWSPGPFKAMLYNESIATAFAFGARVPYAQKKHAAVFRGSCNSPSREDAMKLSQQHPDVLDVACNRDGIPLLNFSEYKVVLNMLGNGWTARTPWLLALGSPMVFLNGGERKLAMDCIWYPLLQPFVHYWPIASLGQLLPAASYLLDHPAEAEAMAAAAAQFVRDWLNTDEIDCVWLLYARVLAELGVPNEQVRPPSGSVHLPTGMAFKQMVNLYYAHPWVA